MAKMADLKVNAVLINAVSVRPGDTLILITPTSMTMEDHARMTRQLEGELPGVRVATFDNVSQAFVYRPEASE